MNARAVLLVALLAVPAGAAERSGDVRFVEVREDRTLQQTESAILRRPLKDIRGFVSRTGLHVFVAEGRDAWDADVAPRITEAIAAGPGGVAALSGGLHAGPDIDGAALEVSLPGGRGDAFVAIHFPLLLDRGRGDKGLLDAVKPNKGLYVSGVDVSGGDGFSAVYVPGRPKGMSRGGPPEVRPKPLPRSGELVVFRGKGGSGRDAAPLREDLRDLFGRERLTPKHLRTFPAGDEGLDRELKTFRVDAETLDADDGWYRALASGPDAWRSKEAKLAHPVRYITFTAPVAVADADGTQRVVILGGVATYAPLVMKAFQAPLYLGVPSGDFFAAVHRGEVPFLRDGDHVFFHRAHLDRWKAGEGTAGGGKDRGRKGVQRLLEELGERSKGARRADPQAMPRRFAPAPEDAPAPVRGRFFDDDVKGWLGHFDRRADFGPEPLFALRDTPGGPRFQAAFGGGGGRRVSAGGAPVLEALDLYPLEPTCKPGESAVAAFSFVVDAIPDGEDATLNLSWSLVHGSKALVRLGTTLVRGAGEHEIYVQAGCPDERGAATFEAVMTWEATGLSVTRSTTLTVD